ncbi:hypothetical protein EDC96DRAFT_446862, partial [Choanephora cucurbitarum]
VCIINEHMFSQTCLYCFQKSKHPLFIKENIKGIAFISSMCVNQDCISTKCNKAAKSRDTLSPFTIGLSSLSYVVFGQRLSTFSPKRNQSI